MIRMLIVATATAFAMEGGLCEEVALHLAYRRFLPPRSRDTVPEPLDFLGQLGATAVSATAPCSAKIIQEAVVRAFGMDVVSGQGLGLRGRCSVMAVDSSLYHCKAPDESTSVADVILCGLRFPRTLMTIKVPTPSQPAELIFR